MPYDPASSALQADKENFSQNVTGQGQADQAAQKSAQQDVHPKDKAFVKAHIFNALEVAIIQLENKKIS